MSLQSSAVNETLGISSSLECMLVDRYDDWVSIGVAEDISPDPAMIEFGLLNAAAMPSIAR